MPGDGGTAESALIASRRDHDHAAPDRLIERLFERLYPIDGRLRQREAQIDHTRARLIQSSIAVASSWGVALGMDSEPESVSPNTGRMSSVQSGQMAGAGEPRFAARIPATKVP